MRLVEFLAHTLAHDKKKCGTHVPYIVCITLSYSVIDNSKTPTLESSLYSVLGNKMASKNRALKDAKNRFKIWHTIWHTCAKNHETCAKRKLYITEYKGFSKF